MFINVAFADPSFYFTWILIVTFSICVHEYAHAVTALKHGDDTAAHRGHLTLNPLVQMGPVSLVVLLVVGIAWGAVPIHPGAYRRYRDRAGVAFAGPLANCILCLIFVVLFWLFRGLSFPSVEMKIMVLKAMRMGMSANAMLAIFNMLPIPILDGWTVWGNFFPGMRSVNPAAAQQVSMFAILIIFVSPLGELLWSFGVAFTDVLTGGGGI